MMTGLALAFLALSPSLYPQTSEPPEPIPPVKSSITVLESIEAEAPASVTVIPKKGIEQIPGINLDDRLRMIPGFSLFRRTSSLVAHPTTQGISLRGIGSTGASRTLVLWDGIPVNDPFGGWVYWTRLSPEDMERVEISRGAATSVFGDRAMGGAIGLFSREPEPLHLTAAYEAGNRGTHLASTGFSNIWSRWALSARGRAFTTDGYYIVPEYARGPIDTKANVQFVTGMVRGDYLGGNTRVFLKTDILAEDRANGTPLQNNSTGLGAVAGNVYRSFGKHDVSGLAWHSREEFRSTFSAIGPNRASETLTFRQTVPAESVGGAGIWKYGGGRFSTLAGMDFQHVEGYSTDTLATGAQRVGGGTLTQHGYFGQANLTAGTTRFFVGARENLAGTGRRFFSPSAGVVAGRGRVRGRLSAYRSFRLPTLNELYREFRVGNAVTQANANLRPETLAGVEAGADFSGETARASLSVYRHSLHDLITNVTLSLGPTIIRQRQNAAEALARGVELNVEKRWRAWRGEASYLFADSRFSSGERIPQVPRHQGSAQLSFLHKGTLASAGFRSYSYQFEDERNLFLLPGFATFQLVVRQQLTRGLSAVAAVENIFDREYLAGFSPTPLIGAPRLWRAGLRWDGRLR
jgi:outer membrane receptor protein involved in Fe transport